MDDQQASKNITRKDIASGFGILLRLLVEHRKAMIVFISLGIIVSIGNALVPYIVGMFIDTLVTPGKTFQVLGLTLPGYIAILGLWGMVQVVVMYAQDFIGRHSDNQGVAVYAEYLRRGIAHILRLPLSFHKSRKIGEVFQKINMTADNIESIVAGTIIQLGPQILSIFVAFAITFFINPIIGGFLLLMVLIYLVFFIRGIKPLADLQETQYRVFSQVWGDAYDYIENARQIKESGAEDEVEHRLRVGFQEKMIGIWRKMHFVAADLSLWQHAIIVVSQFSIFVYSVYAVLGNTMTVGELLAVNGYAQMIFGPFVIIGRTWKNVQNGIININETQKILDLPEEAYEPEHVAPLTSIKGDVALEHVDFWYNKNRPILRDISLHAKPGETVALVGESGVGKTTLVDLILGFHFPNKGTLTIDGEDIRRINLRMLRNNVAIVSQDIVLFNDTIANNIAFGKRTATHEELVAAADKADALEFIEKFSDGWKQMVGERGIKLSGGQRQRVALARAILADPTILILDEPTSALDARAEQKIQRSLAKIMAGKTTFIIAHRLSTVRDADKIIVLKGGKVIETGTHERLIAKKTGEYKHLYELQIGLRE